MIFPKNPVTNTTDINSNDCAFAGITYLAEKFKLSSSEILALFVECDYSISHTTEMLQSKNAA